MKVVTKANEKTEMMADYNTTETRLQLRGVPEEKGEDIRGGNVEALAEFLKQET